MNFNLTQYLQNQLIDFKERETQIVLTTCPFCNNINYKGNYHKNRFYINKDTYLWNCFNCQESGNIYKLRAKLEDKTIAEVIGSLKYQNVDEDLKLDFEQQQKVIDYTIPEIPMPSCFERLILEAGDASTYNRFKDQMKCFEYIAERGFWDLDLIKKMDLRFCKFGVIQYRDKTITISNRLIFPIYWGNKLVAWQGRDITGQNHDQKYFISPDFKKTYMLYGYDDLFEAEYVTLCEGIVDYIKSVDINAIPLFGKTISTRQIELLSAMPNLKRVYVCLDSEVMDKALELAAKLADLWEVWVIDVEAGDPGEKTRKQMQEYFKKAKKFEKGELNIRWE